MRAQPEKILTRLRAGDEAFDAEVVPGLVRTPFEIDVEAPIVRAVRQAATHPGHAPAARAEPYWTDCAILADAGIPRSLRGERRRGARGLGVGGRATVEKLAEILRDAAVAFCGRA